ncbi:putative NRPS-like enzyme [Durotheca rogersii]|uniref:putative NRPS-like enzyme n=1 Tax=Durotheca rogersii TaxID=419775 RepID=UPI002220DB37|nr:putative NRPS-like enzyme [Durotheca rogersii]KAI5866324.1 putative NRPS-like enzyme [Durotheca rogersii]
MAFIDTTKDLSALFDRQVQATPDLVALEDGPTTLSYAELDRLVAALAARLRRCGVVRDSLVGVLLGRGADYVISCLAALRAGGAFLVLELAYPPSLLADVIEDARPTVILTHKAHADKIKADIPLIVLGDEKVHTHGIDGTNGVNGADDAANSHLPLPPEDDLEKLAFVSYSSGTTGRPKGIANPHRAPVLSYNLRFALSDLQPGDRVACNVFFVWEILRPLLRGATVVTVPDETSYDPVALVELLRSKRVTETLMTPTLLAAVLTRHSQLGTRLPDLRTVWLNGEVVTTDLARRALKALPNSRLLNVYSASETHEISCGDIRDMFSEEARVVPVGPPLDPKHTYILDGEGNRVEPGAGGELFVGGDLLARGYLNLPEATAKAFTDDPFSSVPGARMYRTGDSARILPSGLLEITGRVGAMIKIRGYSVQPPAVENAIVKHLAVRSCAVVANGDGLDRQLLAYFVPDDEPGSRTVVKIDEFGLSPVARRALSDHLAHYMIPALWVELDSLPTHEVSGKVDLKRLPPPTRLRKPVSSLNGGGGGQSSRTPRNLGIALEDIAWMWAAALNIPFASVMAQEHNFFDLGGHSLALVDLVTRFTGAYGFPVPLGRLAGNPTLAGHLEVVRDARDGHTAAVQADLPAILRADSVLPADIQPPVGAKVRCLSDADTILLTGGTGFLGAFLLRAVLDATAENGAYVICLVRFADLGAESEANEAAGVARIRRNLLDLGLWDDAILDRVEVLPANLARRRFGLAPDVFDALAARVHVIVHAAATVNLVYPYAAMQGANVFGTREVLRLACLSGATVHHVSTNGVLPPSAEGEGWTEDDVPLGEPEEVVRRLPDGYGQTKWIAEQLVIEAAARGLPARIYRPGTLSGHGSSGSANPYDLLNALIVESLRLGCAPRVEGWYAEMTPVDFVAGAIAALADLPDLPAVPTQDQGQRRGQEKPKQQLIFHLGDPSPLPTEEIFRLLGDLGYPTRPLAWDAWVELWEQQQGTSRVKGENEGGGSGFTADILRRGMPTADFLRSAAVLRDPATATALARAGLRRPAIDRPLLETYVRHFCARGWLPMRPRRHQKPLRINGVDVGLRPRGPLAGRVAVVTGASSGIGAAVAEALAREGAHVAIGARRANALEALKAKILSGNGGQGGVKVLARATDVTDRAQVDALVREAEVELGSPPDILVCCAGVMYYTLMANARADEWERTVEVNCKGLLHCLAATVPGMVARGRANITNGGDNDNNANRAPGPHIVAVSSDAGRKVFAGLGVYSASKFFVEAALQALRLETVGSGLRVTSVQPGNTATELLAMSTDAEAVKRYGEPSGARVLDAKDVADAIVWAVTRPPHVAVNEVLVEPRDEPI